ncbi:MAG: carboxymuconolactone decarboxylase family protein [Planctomycetota bacterium]|jgi:alkylhydroperoxidase family enzyme
MAWIECISEGEASGELASLYQSLVDPESGNVDNILKVHSLHLRGLRAHLAVYRAAMAGTASLRKVDRELIALQVSKLNGCHY